MPTRHERRSMYSRRLEAAALAGAVLLTVLLCQLASAGQGSGDAHGAAGSTRTGLPYAGADADPAAAARTVEALHRSAPIRLRIPRTDTDVPVAAVAGSPGKRPPRGTDPAPGRALWYRGGPSPGEPGPAVLTGRLDAAVGRAGRAPRAALAGLGGLRRGAAVDIWRADGSRARFVVDTVTRYGTPGRGDAAPGPSALRAWGCPTPPAQAYGDGGPAGDSASAPPELHLIACADARGRAGVVATAHLADTPPA